MSAPPIPPSPPRTISHVTHATHEWRMLFAVLEYLDGLPSQDARTLWLDRLQSLRPALFDSLLQLQQLRQRADACGFMRTPPIVSDRLPGLRTRVDDLTRGYLRDV